MYSSKFLMGAAIAIVAMLCCSQYVAAASTTETVTVTAESDHASAYDSVVNVADESDQTNQASWNPATEGIWIGSSTEESLFQFNNVVTNGSCFNLIWIGEFNATIVGSGVSDFTIRLPTHFPDDESWDFVFYAYKIDAEVEDITYTSFDTDGGLIWNVPANATAVFGLESASSTDHSVLDGDSYWTLDQRTYIRVYGALYSNTKYLFQVQCVYRGAEETRYAMYLSPNDVGRDGILNTTISHSEYYYGAYTATKRVDIDVDLGVSYDMKKSLGNGVFQESFHLSPGSTIMIQQYNTEILDTTGYHVFLMPFKTESGSANFSVEVKDAALAGSTYYSVGAWNYKDYIIASSSSTITVAPDAAADFYVFLTAQEEMDISLVLEATDITNEQITWFGVTGSEFMQNIYYHVQSAYGVSYTSVGTPNFAGSDGEWLNYVPELEPAQAGGNLWCVFFLNLGTIGLQNPWLLAIPGGPALVLLQAGLLHPLLELQKDAPGVDEAYEGHHQG